MAKKRKSIPATQSSTILDFFNRGYTESNERDAKKPKKFIARRNSVPAVKHEPQDIIVVNDSDDDNDIEILPIPPVPLPVQNGAFRSGSIGHKEVCDATNAQIDFSKEIKSEHEQSLFGLPSELLLPLGSAKQGKSGGLGSVMLAIREQPNVMNDSVPPLALPIESPHHDVAAQSHIQMAQNKCTQIGQVDLHDEGDWDRGDDEVEFVEEDSIIKVEAEDSVDIDLTLDDDQGVSSSTLDLVQKAVEDCPVCEKELTGMSQVDIHNHVHECLDKPPDSRTSIVEFASSPKLVSALPTIKVPKCEPQPFIEQEGQGDGNIFKTLMSSFKENEVWKEASTVEDRGFRPTKANGGRRKAPFFKVMQGMPIAVDAFRYGTIPNVTAYFLTHAHSDHYTNLSARWDSGPIYCSEGTANLIKHMLGVNPKWVYALPMDVATTIPNTGGVQVTLIEANHCPGSCLFLFEGKQTVNAGDSAYKSSYVGSAKIFRYLHCGDFRASPQHVLHPAVKGKHIDHCYLDTTYLNPKYCFPPQPLVISACAELAKRLVRGQYSEEETGDAKPRTMTGWFTRVETGKDKTRVATSPGKVLFVVGTYSIGKERIVKAIAHALGTKVYCDSRKTAILRCQSDSELDALLTTDPFAAGVHLVPLAFIATDRLQTYVERWKGHWSKVVAFRPTGWTFTPPNGNDMLPSIPTIISRSQSRTFTHANLQPARNSTAALQVYGVPYSEHSSFFELTCFALSFEWTRMIATVNVGSEASRAKMAKWVERWEAERKKRDKIEVVGYRAQDYW